MCLWAEAEAEVEVALRHGVGPGVGVGVELQVHHLVVLAEACHSPWQGAGAPLLQAWVLEGNPP